MTGCAGASAFNGVDWMEVRAPSPTQTTGPPASTSLTTQAEFALLLDLRDVYWANQGRGSVDPGVGVVAAGGTAFSAVLIFRRLAHNRRP